MLFSHSRLLLHEGYDKTRIVIGWTPVLQLITKFCYTPYFVISGILLYQVSLYGVSTVSHSIEQLNPMTKQDNHKECLTSCIRPLSSCTRPPSCSSHGSTAKTRSWSPTSTGPWSPDPSWPGTTCRLGSCPYIIKHIQVKYHQEEWAKWKSRVVLPSLDPRLFLQ